MRGKVGLWSGDRKDTKITLWRRGIPRMVLDMIGKGATETEGKQLRPGPYV